MCIESHFFLGCSMQIMGLSYAVTAPLVLPAAAAFFFTAWVRLLCCLCSVRYPALGCAANQPTASSVRP